MSFGTSFVVLNFVRIGGVRKICGFCYHFFGIAGNFSIVRSATLQAANMSQKTHRRHAPTVYCVTRYVMPALGGWSATPVPSREVLTQSPHPTSAPQWPSGKTPPTSRGSGPATSPYISPQMHRPDRPHPHPQIWSKTASNEPREKPWEKPW